MTHLNRWLRDVQLGDPPEDVFSGNITAPFPQNFRVFLGQQAMADRVLEDILITLAKLAKEDPRFEAALNPVLNIIRMTDAIANKLGISRYFASERCPDNVKVQRWEDLVPALGAVIFTAKSLEEWGIDAKSLNTFISSEIGEPKCPDGVEGAHSLVRYPVIRKSDNWLLSLPSSIHETVIRFLFEWVGASEEVELFNKVLADIQWSRLVHDAIPKLGVRQRSWQGPKPSLPDFVYSTEVAIIGADSLLNLVFLPVWVQNFGNCLGQCGLRLLPDEQAIFTNFLVSCHDSIRSQFDPRKIFTVIVLGNLGMGFSVPLPDVQPSWSVTALPCHDLHLLAEGGGSMRDLFRSQQHESEIMGHGIRVMNWAGALNTHAARIKSGGVLVPKEFHSGYQNLLMFDASFISDWRKDVRQRCDHHIVEHPFSGRTVVLRRFRPHSKWPSEQRWHLYVDAAAVTDPEQPRFSGVIREPHGDLWLECSINDQAQAYRGTVRELWECLFIWFGQLWERWPDRSTPIEPMIVGLICEAPMTTFQNTPSQPSECVAAECLPKYRAIRLTIPKGYIQEFHHPTNEAERKIVIAVARALRWTPSSGQRSWF